MIVRLKVKQYRLERGLSEARLAEIIGVQQPFISKIESGLKYPNIVTLCHIAKALNCNPGDLIECIE